MKQFRLLFVLIIIIFNKSLANISQAGFENFPNHYFVATGLFANSLDFAIRAKFPEIHVIMSDELTVTNTRNKFIQNNNVNIWYADSSVLLGYIISKMDKAITFWLDGGNGAQPNIKNNPILEELEYIKNHPIKTHTILIDDMHVVGTLYFDYITKEQIIEKILEINPDYTITYIDGGNEGEFKNNIMVAYINN